MDKNIIRDVDEQNNAIALETEKASSRLEFSELCFIPSVGWPANIIEQISVATTIDELAVFLIQLSPSFLSSSCIVANKTYGVSPASFFISFNVDLTTFSTSFPLQMMGNIT